MRPDQFLPAVERVFDQCKALMVRKNSDYSSRDDAFGNIRLCEALGLCRAEIGLLTRISDKLGRIIQLLGSQRSPKVAESIQDTILDAINYLAMLYVWLVWREAKKKKGTESCEQ